MNNGHHQHHPYDHMSTYKSFASTLTLCIVSLFAYEQEQIKKHVQEQSVQLTTIEPDNTNYEDLKVIGEAVGDARVIMLGEQDHGDAPTFLAKTRLIKYLHEKKGFNVLAFESDFFSTNYNWQAVKEGKLSVADFVKGNITALWSECYACHPLFKQYLPHTLNSGNPLEVTGFDSQVSSKFLLSRLDSVLYHLNIPMTTLPGYKSEIFPLLTTWHNHTKDSTTTDKIIGFYKEIREQLLTKVPIDNFWVKAVENLIQQNVQFRNWKQDYWKDMNTRDEQMAANLKWIVETKYPNEKVIVWAHNYHVSKYARHYPEGTLNEAVTMGTVFTQDPSLLYSTYILGFTSYKGTAGRLFTKIYKINKPKANSFENWLNPKYEYAFVDFKKYNAEYPVGSDPFYLAGATKGNQYHSSQLGVWNRIFDGVFYIKEMYPCKK